MKSHIKSYLELCKVKVALLSSFSAGAGFLFATPKLTLPILIVVPGVFLLACGSLVLNQYQERDLDAMMTRTCMRPIPSGRVRAHDALFLSGALLFAGCAALLMAGLDGVQNKINPGEPLDKNIYELPPEELKKVPNVTGSLGEALDCLQMDHEFLLKGDVFTSDFLDMWISTKRKEHDALRLRPHPYEFFLYFDV